MGEGRSFERRTGRVRGMEGERKRGVRKEGRRRQGELKEEGIETMNGRGAAKKTEEGKK